MHRLTCSRDTAGAPSGRRVAPGRAWHFPESLPFRGVGGLSREPFPVCRRVRLIRPSRRVAHRPHRPFATTKPCNSLGPSNPGTPRRPYPACVSFPGVIPRSPAGGSLCLRFTRRARRANGYQHLLSRHPELVSGSIPPHGRRRRNARRDAVGCHGGAALAARWILERVQDDEGCRGCRLDAINPFASSRETPLLLFRAAARIKQGAPNRGDLG